MLILRRRCLVKDLEFVWIIDDLLTNIQRKELKNENLHI